MDPSATVSSLSLVTTVVSIGSGSRLVGDIGIRLGEAIRPSVLAVTVVVGVFSIDVLRITVRGTISHGDGTDRIGLATSNEI